MGFLPPQGLPAAIRPGLFFAPWRKSGLRGKGKKKKKTPSFCHQETEGNKLNLVFTSSFLCLPSYCALSLPLPFTRNSPRPTPFPLTIGRLDLGRSREDWQRSHLSRKAESDRAVSFARNLNWIKWGCIFQKTNKQKTSGFFLLSSTKVFSVQNGKK